MLLLEPEISMKHRDPSLNITLCQGITYWIWKTQRQWPNFKYLRKMGSDFFKQLTRNPFSRHSFKCRFLNNEDDTGIWQQNLNYKITQISRSPEPPSKVRIESVWSRNLKWHESEGCESLLKRDFSASKISTVFQKHIFISRKRRLFPVNSYNFTC